MALLLLIGTFIGMEIPLLIRINRRYAQNLRGNLSQILSMDYIGSLTGALVFTYVLLTRVSLARIGFFLGATNIAVALLGLYAFRGLIERPARLLGVALVALGSIVTGLIWADDWTQAFEQRYFADPIVYRETTKYQHIVMTRSGQRVNLYLNGHLQFSSDDEHIYHELLVHPPMLLAKRKARVLVLGGGDGLAVREVLKHPQVREVTLVDIDAAMIRLAKTHPELVRLNNGALKDARVHLAHSRPWQRQGAALGAPQERAWRLSLFSAGGDRGAGGCCDRRRGSAPEGAQGALRRGAP